MYTMHCAGVKIRFEFNEAYNVLKQINCLHYGFILVKEFKYFFWLYICLGIPREF